METHNLGRNTYNLVERGIRALESIADELERLNDNLEAADSDGVQEGDE